MWTESKRILIRDGHFGFALRQVAGGAEPLYLVTTTDGTATIRASGDFIRTDWDGVERRKAERRQAERRAGLGPPASSVRERRKMDRRASRRRQFTVRRLERRSEVDLAKPRDSTPWP